MMMCSHFSFEGMEDLPYEMLKNFAWRDPIDAAGGWIWLPVILWCLPLLCILIRALSSAGFDFCRSHKGDPSTWMCIVILIVVETFGVNRAIAEKGGGGTNTPPAVVSESVKRINLYYQDATGRLIPIGARIERIAP